MLDSTSTPRVPPIRHPSEARSTASSIDNGCLALCKTLGPARNKTSPRHSRQTSPADSSNSPHTGVHNPIPQPTPPTAIRPVQLAHPGTLSPLRHSQTIPKLPPLCNLPPPRHASSARTFSSTSNSASMSPRTPNTSLKPPTHSPLPFPSPKRYPRIIPKIRHISASTIDLSDLLTAQEYLDTTRLTPTRLGKYGSAAEFPLDELFEEVPRGRVERRVSGSGVVQFARTPRAVSERRWERQKEGKEAGSGGEGLVGLGAV